MPCLFEITVGHDKITVVCQTVKPNIHVIDLNTSFVVLVLKQVYVLGLRAIINI